MRILRSATLLLMGLLWLEACGYSLRTSAGRLPDGSQAIAIPLAEDQSAEAGAGAELSSLLREEARRRGLGLVSGAAQLQARIRQVDARPRAVALAAGRFRAREQEVTIKVDFELKLKDGRNLPFSLSERASYLSAPDLRNTLANRHLALQQAMERIAQSAIERISRDF